MVIVFIIGIFAFQPALKSANPFTEGTSKLWQAPMTKKENDDAQDQQMSKT